jgi:hypothetical protein
MIEGSDMKYSVLNQAEELYLQLLMVAMTNVRLLNRLLSIIRHYIIVFPFMLRK